MIKNTIKIRFAVIVLTILSFLSGCAIMTDSKPKKVDVREYSNLTTVDAVKKLESNLKQSAANDLATYAPEHYSTADKALVEARTLISNNKSRDQIVQKVAVASAVLRNGELVMRKVKDVLENQLIVKEKLDSLKTNKVYRSEYGSLEERLNNIIREIENGELTKNKKNRVKLLQDLQKLERRSIRYNAMHEPEEILKRVKYRGGEKLAPLTYHDALAVFQRAEEFITHNPNYETGIEQMGQEALFSAKRALYITEQVASLSQKVTISLEQVILDEEYRLYRVARELDSIDLRDNPLEMQSEQLAKIAKNKAEEYRNKEELIVALRDTLIKVRDSSAELTALNDTSIRFKKEKGEWIAKEALYKAKVSHLETTLNQSQNQLDQTQQKLLSMQNDNQQKKLAGQKPGTNQANSDSNKKMSNTSKAAMSAVAIQKTNKEKIPAAASTQVQSAPPTNSTDAIRPEVATQTPIEKHTPSKTDNSALSTTEAPAVESKPSSQPQVVSTPPEKSIIKEETKQVEAKESMDSSDVSTLNTKNRNTTVSKTKNISPDTRTASANSQTKSQITEKETMDALNSVMELISINSKKEAKSNVFVDAGE